MVVLLAPHPRKNSSSFRVIARRHQSLPLTLLTRHLLSITSGKVEGVEFWAVLLGVFCQRACKRAGSLGRLRSRAHWSDISQGGDQEITPLVRDGSSQFLLSGYQQCWIYLVNYRGRWDLLRQSNWPFSSLNEEDDGKKSAMTGDLGHWNFLLFSSKTTQNVWPWFTPQGFSFPLHFLEKGQPSLSSYRPGK